MAIPPGSLRVGKKPGPNILKEFFENPEVLIDILAVNSFFFIVLRVDVHRRLQKKDTISLAYGIGQNAGLEKTGRI